MTTRTEHKHERTFNEEGDEAMKRVTQDLRPANLLFNPGPEFADQKKLKYKAMKIAKQIALGNGYDYDSE